MSHEVVRTYDRLGDAEQARLTLLSSGFDADSVHLSSTVDEAGPVEGNFLVGNGRRSSGRADAYDRNYAQVAHRGSVLLTVDAEDGEQQRRAAGILDASGAFDVHRADSSARRT
ncbi:hypothetical protein OOT46_19810 [Aquabacterium sp. A7-Y]|uniref:hypothetical protein n=1 Tax=Aquabacterium sp. A7-Y TaxID=1349605 RepID=UPI00223DEC73|nr:hypothetical protein [Aquabacterium sp. A7-Y]MCW7540085.1 hypothetical protein [Aquabacterium sp. A7-Y]